MNMKKIIALFTAAAVITCFAGCSTKDEGTADTAEVSTSEASAPEAESTSKPAEDEASSAESVVKEDMSLSEMLESRGDELWLAELAEKVNSWENNIIITVNYDYEGLVTRIEAEKLGDKMRMETEVFGFAMNVLVDGTNTYLIDDNTSTYCIDTTGSVYDSSQADAYLMEDQAAEAFVGAGIETVDGTEYLYEEYNVEGQNIRYYFDDECNVQYIGSEVDGVVTYMEFTVELADKPDEAAFELPAGYTEVTMDEYNQNVYGDIFAE